MNIIISLSFRPVFAAAHVYSKLMQVEYFEGPLFCFFLCVGGEKERLFLAVTHKSFR